MTFVERLNKTLIDKGITPYKLSKETGIAQSQISNWRKGLKLPSCESIMILSTYFKISVDYLLGIDENIELSEQEQELIALFRRLHPYDQQDLLGNAKMKADRVEQERTCQSSNNDSGQTA